MQVVLLEDVKSLGKKGQIVNVNDGYARNFILKKNLGVEATAKNLNDLKLQKANAEKIAAEQLAAAKELAEKLEGMSVTLSMKAGEGGKAFGSVSGKEIAAAAKEQLNLEIDKKKLGAPGGHQDLRNPRGPRKAAQRRNRKTDCEGCGGVRESHGRGK